MKLSKRANKHINVTAIVLTKSAWKKNMYWDKNKVSWYTLSVLVYICVYDRRNFIKKDNIL